MHNNVRFWGIVCALLTDSCVERVRLVGPVERCNVLHTWLPPANEATFMCPYVAVSGGVPTQLLTDDTHVYAMYLV
jgi:hypothetical protein